MAKGDDVQTTSNMMNIVDFSRGFSQMVKNLDLKDKLDSLIIDITSMQL